MRKWQLAFVLAATALIVTNALWANAFLDQAVTLKYSDAISYEQASAIQDLGTLIVKGSSSYSKKDILFLLRQAKPDAFIVDDGETVIYEGMRFRFSAGRLVEIGSEHAQM